MNGKGKEYLYIHPIGCGFREERLDYRFREERWNRKGKEYNKYRNLNFEGEYKNGERIESKNKK